MRASLLSALPGLIFTISVLARPQAPIPGYTVTDAIWDLELTPGGPRLNITGTVQEVIAQVSSINPNWKEQFNFTTNAASTNFTYCATTDCGPSIQAPQSGTLFFSPATCNSGFITSARYDAIIDGIHYLRNINGRPNLSSGPAHCSRISCSWNSAIFWCNDNLVEMNLESYGQIADGAFFILQQCRSNWGAHSIGGQAFNQDGWNVFVTGVSPGGC